MVTLVSYAIICFSSKLACVQASMHPGFRVGELDIKVSSYIQAESGGLGL